MLVYRCVVARVFCLIGKVKKVRAASQFLL